MSSSFHTRSEDVLTVLSNIFLLIPAATAIIYRRYIRSILLIIETVISSLMHLCDSFGVCAASFQTLSSVDFFFAQWMIPQIALLIPYWGPRYQWLEYWLLILSGLAIYLFQVYLPNQLYVQAGIVIFCVLCVLIYWLVYALRPGGPRRLPPYFFTGLLLLLISVMLFGALSVWPTGYFAAHSLWHMLAALGYHFFLQIKRPGPHFFFSPAAGIPGPKTNAKSKSKEEKRK